MIPSTAVIQVPYQFIKDVEFIDINKMCSDIETVLPECNEDWQFSFGNSKDIVKHIKAILEKADFREIDSISSYGQPVFYWCGCLTAEPWQDLEMEEEDILNAIVKHHLFIDDDAENGIRIVFRANLESPLQKFFTKNSNGYGLNVPYGINSMLHFLGKWIKTQLNENLDRYGSWEQNEPIEEEKEDE
jgi:hypothetical protein